MNMKMSSKLRKGQKVIVINAYNPFFGMEGKVLSSSDDLLSVRLIDGSVRGFERYEVEDPQKVTPEELSNRADWATSAYLRGDMDGVIRDKIRNTFSDLPEVAIEAVTEELAPRILEEIFWDW